MCDGGWAQGFTHAAWTSCHTAPCPANVVVLGTDWESIFWKNVLLGQLTANSNAYIFKILWEPAFLSTLVTSAYFASKVIKNYSSFYFFNHFYLEAVYSSSNSWPCIEATALLWMHPQNPSQPTAVVLCHVSLFGWDKTLPTWSKQQKHSPKQNRQALPSNPETDLAAELTIPAHQWSLQCGSHGLITRGQPVTTVACSLPAQTETSAVLWSSGWEIYERQRQMGP